MDRRALLCVACVPAKFCESISDINQHLRIRHPHLARYYCGACQQEFQHKTSFIRHIGTRHSARSVESEGSVPSASTAASSSNQHFAVADVDEGPADDSFGDDTRNAEEDTASQQITTSFDIKAEAALFLLRLRSSGNITHASVFCIQNFVQELLVNIIGNVLQDTSQFLQECGILPEQSVPFLAQQTAKKSNPFEGMETIEEQLQYFCDKYGMVVPEGKYLGSRIENRFDREVRMFIPRSVPETFQYVSIIDTLKHVVRNSFLRNLILSEKKSDDRIFRNYKDGSDYKSNRFLQKYPDAIRIVKYLDDLEISNALGSKDCIHKLACFYFCIQNLPPEESSQLSSVFLFALAYAEDLKSKGVMAKVLKPFIDEVKILMSDEGVAVDLPEGGIFILRACVVCLSSDSLAAHDILGMMSPSANRFCRLCMVTLNDLRRDTAATGQLRTSQLHKQHVRQVELNPARAKDFGVKEKSALMEIMRVPEDSVLDAFHDLVGVAQMILKLALYEFICVRKLFKVEDFNCNVNMFDYGSPDVKNKHSANFLRRKLVDKGHSLKQSGSQTLCLLRVFPFIITGVEAGDPYLELVHQLQDIVRIIFSFEVSETEVLHLENLVEEHQQLFHKTFVSPPIDEAEHNAEENIDGEESGEEDCDDDQDDGDDGEDNSEEIEIVRPRARCQSKRLKKSINKLHHLKHYGPQIREKGPIIRLMCAKFEARHRIFRKHSAVQSNFKNPPKTMARMFQLSTLGPLIAMKQPRSERGFNYVKANACLVRNCPYQDLLLLEGLQEGDEVKVAKGVEVSGIEYSCGHFVLLNAMPLEFGLISDVLIIEVQNKCPRVLLVTIKCLNQGLDPRYNAYSISNNFSEPAQLLDVAKLKHYRPIAPWSPVRSATVSLYLYPRTIYV